MRAQCSARTDLSSCRAISAARTKPSYHLPGGGMFNFDEAIENAWVRCGGQCEGKHAVQGRATRCRAMLQWGRRGGAQQGAWEAYRTGPCNLGGWVDTSRCQILCPSCYAKTSAAQSNAEAPARGIPVN